MLVRMKVCRQCGRSMEGLSFCPDCGTPFTRYGYRLKETPRRDPIQRHGVFKRVKRALFFRQSHKLFRSR